MEYNKFFLKSETSFDGAECRMEIKEEVLHQLVPLMEVKKEEPEDSPENVHLSVVKTERDDINNKQEPGDNGFGSEFHLMEDLFVQEYLIDIEKRQDSISSRYLDIRGEIPAAECNETVDHTGASTSGSSNMPVIISSNEAEFSRYTCDTCGNSYRSKYCITTHMQQHSTLPLFKCNVCNMCFSQLSHLTQHKVIHLEIKPYRCNICGNCYTRLDDLNQHSLFHSKLKPHTCTICSSSFTLKSNFIRHMRMHSQLNAHKCDICGKCYKRLDHFNQHLLFHSGVKLYKCTICGVSFAEKCNIVLHMYIHSGDKPHKCDVCGKCFNRQHTLNEHMLLHSGD